MLEQPTIELRDVTGRVVGEQLILEISVFNPEDRTLYAISSPRRIQYDAATRTLTVALHDEHVGADHPIAPHLPQPQFAPLEGNAVTPLRVPLPRVVRRIRDAAERAGGPIVEELPISQATTVTVEVAHQDTPFYFNPAQDKRAQLRSWAEQIATVTTPISISGPDGEAS